MPTNRRKIRLAFAISIEVRWFHLEWLYERLDPEHFEVFFILVCFRGRTPYMESFVQKNRIPYLRVDCDLQPFSIFRAVRKIAAYCREQRLDIVHTHMLLASLTGLLGAYLAHVPVRVNTRHHLIPNHGKPTILLDRLANALTTHVIVCSRLGYDILKNRENIPEGKLTRIPLGIDLNLFREVEPARVEALRQKYNPNGKSPVIGVIARYKKSKGIQYIIPAFQKLLKRYPDAYLMLAYARGAYRDNIREALAALPTDNYAEIVFEEDVFALYQLMDVCVHVPIGRELESFGLVYIEAMAAGVPTVFTSSGVGPELLVHRRNTWLVDFESSDQIHEGLEAVLGSAELRDTLIAEGRRSADDYQADQMVQATARLYRDSFVSTSHQNHRTEDSS